MTQNVKDLRAEVARLSGSMPDSTNAKHLTERLTELRAPAVVSVSMNKAGQLALARIVERELPGKRDGRPRLSELVRKALAEYARARGLEDEAALLEETSS